MTAQGGALLKSCLKLIGGHGCTPAFDINFQLVQIRACAEETGPGRGQHYPLNFALVSDLRDQNAQLGNDVFCDGIDGSIGYLKTHQCDAVAIDLDVEVLNETPTPVR